MTQNAQILAHLKRGPITQQQAAKLYGCWRLAARINEMRNMGHKINTQPVQHQGRRYAKYWLVKK